MSSLAQRRAARRTTAAPAATAWLRPAMTLRSAMTLCAIAFAAAPRSVGAQSSDPTSLLACQSTFTSQSRSLSDTVADRLQACVGALLTCQIEAEEGSASCSVANPVGTCSTALDAIDAASAQRIAALRQSCQTVSFTALRRQWAGLGFGDLDAACKVDGPEPETLDLLLTCQDRLVRRGAEAAIGALLPRACELLGSPAW
jgi:hypothetical protein